MKSLESMKNTSNEVDPLSGVHKIKLYINDIKRIYDNYIGKNIGTMIKMYIQYLIGDRTKDDVSDY